MVNAHRQGEQERFTSSSVCAHVTMTVLPPSLLFSGALPLPLESARAGTFSANPEQSATWCLSWWRIACATMTTPLSEKTSMRSKFTLRSALGRDSYGNGWSSMCPSRMSY